MKMEYKRRDIIAEIENDRIFVVVAAHPQPHYYEVLEIDRNGNDLRQFYGLDKSHAHRNFVKIGTWRKKIWNLNSW